MGRKKRGRQLSQRPSGESAAGDEAMDVRMMGERLAPCVKNGQEPDLTAEVPRIGGDGLERCGDGVEQDGMDDCLKAISATSAGTVDTTWK